MTLRKRCKVCGKLTGKTHNCPGFKETVSCPKCGEKLLKTSLLKHLNRKCPTKNEKTIKCGCGEEIFRGHGNEARHIKSFKHIQWENKDRELRKLGVKKDLSGRYSVADPNSENIEDMNYYRSVPFGDHIKMCHWLNKRNNNITGKNVIYCYCGLNCPENDYEKHCISDYHKKWVFNCLEFYSNMANTRKVHAQKIRLYRQRRKIRAEFYRKAAEKEASKALNHEKSQKSYNDPDLEFESVNLENNEHLDDTREYRKKALNVLKSLKCTGNCVFYRGKEIEEILEKIEKKKYFEMY